MARSIAVRVHGATGGAVAGARISLKGPGTSMIAIGKTDENGIIQLDGVTFLRHVFERISAYPQDRLEEMLPNQWLPDRAPATS